MRPLGNNMRVISVFIKLKSIDSVESVRLAAGDVLHINTLSILSTERDFFSNIIPCFLSFSIYFMNASDLSSHKGTEWEKKPILHCTALHERRGARGIYHAKSLKENENWIMETTAHFYTSHGMCVCGGESKTFVWVMGNYIDALSFICLSVCCCFRVWIFFSWTETILT